MRFCLGPCKFFKSAKWSRFFLILTKPSPAQVSARISSWARAHESNMRISRLKLHSSYEHNVLLWFCGKSRLVFPFGKLSPSVATRLHAILGTCSIEKLPKLNWKFSFQRSINHTSFWVCVEVLQAGVLLHITSHTRVESRKIKQNGFTPTTALHFCCRLSSGVYTTELQINCKLLTMQEKNTEFVSSFNDFETKKHLKYV